MASSNSIQYSNCEIPKINCTHKWIIPEFESWSSENAGEWLNSPPFFPAQGIKMQLKIIGSRPNSDFRVFLVNKEQKPIYLTKCFLQFFNQRRVGCELCSNTTEVEPDHELAISDEFILPWSSRKCESGSGPRYWSYYGGSISNELTPSPTPGN